MVQLPSAARLSGNSKPGLLGGLLQALQHAAGLDRDRQVGARRWRARAFMRVQAQHHLRARCRRAREPTDQAGVAALRHEADAVRRAQALHHGGHLGGAAGRTTASALPCAALAPVLARRRVRSPSVKHVGGADDAGAGVSSRRAFMACACSCGAAVCRRTAHMQRAGDEQQQAQQHFDHGQVVARRRGRCRRAPRLR